MSLPLILVWFFKVFSYFKKKEMVFDNFGTFITDASGKLHDLSKGAFDTFGMKHEGRFDPDFGTLLKGSFNDGVKNILGKAGITKEQIESFGTSSWADTIKQVVGAVGSEAASAVGGGLIGGPLGAAFGLAVEGGQIISKFSNKTQFDPNVGYGTGQWIAIDNGQTVVTKKMHNVLDDAWKRRRMYGYHEPDPDVQEGEGIAFRDSSMAASPGSSPKPSAARVPSYMSVTGIPNASPAFVTAIRPMAGSSPFRTFQFSCIVRPIHPPALPIRYRVAFGWVAIVFTVPAIPPARLLTSPPNNLLI